MKKLVAFILALACVLGVVGCSNNSMNHIVKTKPNVTGIVQEVHDDYIIMYSDSAKGYPNGSAWQISLNTENKDSYTDLAVGDEIVVYHDGKVMETDPLKVGTVYAITLKTPADRTPNERGTVKPADTPSFGAKVLEVNDNYLLVEPFADSNERKSADKIEVSLADKTSWPIPAVGDTVNVFYSGEIQETYPARITKVYRVEIDASASNTEPESEIPGATRFIVEIWDRAKEEQLDCADAIEKFYEDETTEYYFSCIKSHHIIVMDNTGRTVDIVTALKEGFATIADLDYYGISYFTEPKPKIVEPYSSIPDFSFDEDSKIYVEGTPGVKTTGFVNTSAVEINSINDADEHAKNECTIEWDTIRTYLDTATGIWKVVFSTGTPGGCQSVYLDYHGKTVLIVYGE